MRQCLALFWLAILVFLSLLGFCFSLLKLSLALHGVAVFSFAWLGLGFVWLPLAFCFFILAIVGVGWPCFAFLGWYWMPGTRASSCSIPSFMSLFYLLFHIYCTKAPCFGLILSVLYIRTDAGVCFRTMLTPPILPTLQGVDLAGRAALRGPVHVVRRVEGPRHGEARHGGQAPTVRGRRGMSNQVYSSRPV